MGLVLAGCHTPGRSECCWCSGGPIPGKAWGWLLSDRLQLALAGAPPFGRGGIASLSLSLPLSFICSCMVCGIWVCCEEHETERWVLSLRVLVGLPCLRAIFRVLEDNVTNHISYDLSGRMNICCTAALFFSLSSSYVYFIPQQRGLGVQLRSLLRDWYTVIS